MSTFQTIFLISLSVFSIVDLRTRLVPFIEAFFVITVLVSFPENRLHVTISVLLVVWSLLRGIPSWFALPILFYPIIWPVLIVAFGVRKQIIGRADLFALAMIGFLFPFPAVMISLFGFEVWRRWWMSRGNYGLIPALPGLFLGLVVYNLFQICVG